VGVKKVRYCVRTQNGMWRIWDRKMNKWWGNPSKEFPTSILAKLNSGVRIEKY